jgi:hypothetical protein
MNANVGNADKILRVVVAAVAAVLAFVVGAGTVGGIILLVVAVVMLGTAAVGFCPLYRLFGISTCKVKTAR